jgi:hypothetical protein
MLVGYGWLEGHWIDVTHVCSSVARKLVFVRRTLPRSRRRFQHLLQWEFCRYYSQIQLDPASDDRFSEIHYALIRVSVQGPIFLFFFWRLSEPPLTTFWRASAPSVQVQSLFRLDHPLVQSTFSPNAELLRSSEGCRRGPALFATSDMSCEYKRAA